MPMDKRCLDKDFLALKKDIFNIMSLDCDQYKDPYLQRRIAVRMRATGTKDYAGYRSYLRTDPDEHRKLMADITINVTQFFRDAPVFKTIEEEVLPKLIYDRFTEGNSSIRIWSAGCSTGEEPYSVAIILRELFGEDIGSADLTIIGTDIDDECLEKARTGSYLPRQVLNVPRPYLEKYFTFDGKEYHLCDEVLEMVEFRHLDLFKGTLGKGWDMIFCRNVVIYFTKEMQERLYLDFYNVLNRGGYFIMGNTESLVGPALKKFVQLKARERIYIK